MFIHLSLGRKLQKTYVLGSQFINCIFNFFHMLLLLIPSVTVMLFYFLKEVFYRIPSYFGTMPAAEAARQILDGVRRNYAEFSVPGYLLYLGHVLRYFRHFHFYSYVR